MSKVFSSGVWVLPGGEAAGLPWSPGWLQLPLGPGPGPRPERVQPTVPPALCALRTKLGLTPSGAQRNKAPRRAPGEAGAMCLASGWPAEPGLAAVPCLLWAVAIPHSGVSVGGPGTGVAEPSDSLAGPASRHHLLQLLSGRILQTGCDIVSSPHAQEASQCWGLFSIMGSPGKGLSSHLQGHPSSLSSGGALSWEPKGAGHHCRASAHFPLAFPALTPSHLAQVMGATVTGR